MVGWAAIFVFCYYFCCRWRIQDRNRSGISQALKSILLSSTFASALLSFRFPCGFLCNRRVTVPPERANRLPSWYSQINTTIIRQEVQFNFSLYDILTTKKKRASRSRMYGENPFLTVNNKLFFNSCQSLILNFSEYRHWHF